jgi:hypothetical protein
MPKVIEFNCETNEEVLRNMTEIELEAYDKVLENTAKLESEKLAKDKTRQNVLDKLGLTADEVAALLG